MRITITIEDDRAPIVLPQPVVIPPSPYLPPDWWKRGYVQRPYTSPASGIYPNTHTWVTF